MGDPSPVVMRTIPTDPGLRAGNSLYLTETQGQGFALDRRMLTVGLEPSPERVRERFALPAGTPLLVRRRLFSADGVPVRVSTSWFPTDLAEAAGLTGGDFVDGGLQSRFDRLGLSFGRAVETLVARRVAADEADLLQLDPDDAVIEILRTSYDANDRPVHTLQSICAASRHVFQVRQIEGDRVF